jgi:hypothetical protein
LISPVSKPTANQRLKEKCRQHTIQKECGLLLRIITSRAKGDSGRCFFKFHCCDCFPPTGIRVVLPYFYLIKGHHRSREFPGIRMPYGFIPRCGGKNITFAAPCTIPDDSSVGFICSDRQITWYPTGMLIITSAHKDI